MTETGAVIIEPPNRHRATVIWLHGLGADGHDFEPIVPELHLPEELGIRFIFPHAPVRPVTINGGMAMRAWYDVKHPDLRREEDAESIEHSTHLINGLIDMEVKSGIPPDRIVIAGFSQGGAITLHCGLRYPSRLAGLLVLSAYLPLPTRLAAEKSAANLPVPIMMLHGDFDPVVPLEAGLQSCDYLRQSGYNVEWRTYPIQHSVCAEEVAHISRWLGTALRIKRVA
jgi:Predicted esterase